MPFAIGRRSRTARRERQPPLAVLALALLLLAESRRSQNHAAPLLRLELAAASSAGDGLSHHAARSGPAVRGRLSTGEVVATVTNDSMRAGGAFDITARLSGAIVAYTSSRSSWLSSSTCPGARRPARRAALVLLLGTVIKPLQERQRQQRDEVGRLTALGADTAAGLRVLRGIGGEAEFLHRYRARSQEVRHAGVRVALPQSTLDAAQVFIPGLFVVLVTWIGARFAVSGKIGPGELVPSRLRSLPGIRSDCGGGCRQGDALFRRLPEMLAVLDVERASSIPATRRRTASRHPLRERALRPRVEDSS